MSKVLIVEDEANIRQLVKYNLEKESFQVIEAEDGLQGLRLATNGWSGSLPVAERKPSDRGAADYHADGKERRN